MLKKTIVFIALTVLLIGVVIPMKNILDATPSVILDFSVTTLIICPGGWVADSSTVYDWRYRDWWHPEPTEVFVGWATEPGTGFRYQVYEEVHTDHDIEIFDFSKEIRKYDRYYWKCR